MMKTPGTGHRDCMIHPSTSRNYSVISPLHHSNFPFFLRAVRLLQSANPPADPCFVSSRISLMFCRSECAEVRVILGRVLSVQHRAELGVDFVLELRREGIERARVDHVAAAVFEEAVEQLEVLEGTSVRGVPAVPAKRILKRRRALDAAVLQGVFLAEEEVLHDLFRVAPDDGQRAALGRVGDGFVERLLQIVLPGHRFARALGAVGQLVVQHALVLQHHEGDDVAGLREIGMGVEEAARAT